LLHHGRSSVIAFSSACMADPAPRQRAWSKFPAIDPPGLDPSREIESRFGRDTDGPAVDDGRLGARDKRGPRLRQDGQDPVGQELRPHTLRAIGPEHGQGLPAAGMNREGYRGLAKGSARAMCRSLFSPSAAPSIVIHTVISSYPTGYSCTPAMRSRSPRFRHPPMTTSRSWPRGSQLA